MRDAAAVPGSGAEAEASALLGGDGLLVVGVQAANASASPNAAANAAANAASAARSRGLARIGLASLALVTPV
jgi:hypothetical protein